MHFKEIVQKRYATKKFDNKEIPQDKVDELFEIIRHAPSSYNLQPWKIKIISDKETKDKLSPATYNQPQIKSCSHLLIFCADKNLAEKVNHLVKEMKNAGTPEKIADDFSAMVHGFVDGMSQEQKLSWAQRQLYLAVSNAVNGAKSLGFDSCPMEGFSPSEYSKILALPENLVPTALVAIGYAADTPRDKIRFKKEDVFF